MIKYPIYYKYNTVGHIRIAMFISVCLYIGFAWLDAFLFPEFTANFHQIRFYFVIPAILFGIGYTFYSSSLKYLQQIISICTLIGGYGIIAMLYIGGQEVNILYYVGLILVFIFNYDFLKLRFVQPALSEFYFCLGIFLWL